MTSPFEIPFKKQKCLLCHGSGFSGHDPDKVILCRPCDGRGFLYVVKKVDIQKYAPKCRKVVNYMNDPSRIPRELHNGK